eukprot:6209985-Pleurochrysis_carterae.AAC.1
MIITRVYNDNTITKYTAQTSPPGCNKSFKLLQAQNCNSWCLNVLELQGFAFRMFVACLMPPQRAHVHMAKCTKRQRYANPKAISYRHFYSCDYHYGLQ